MTIQPEELHTVDSHLEKASDTGKLYLIPAPLIPYTVENWQPFRLRMLIPSSNLLLLERIEHFIVESEHNARRLLSRLLSPERMEHIGFSILNEHSSEADIAAPLALLQSGRDCAILPDAGMPCIADPGAALVAEAHRHSIPVIPVGTDSSIILGLAASGLDGQHFRFLGYLPVDSAKMESLLASEAKSAIADRAARIFIETPYRNERTLEVCKKILPDSLTMVFAANLGTFTPCILAMPLPEWKRQKHPIPQVPAVFCFGIPAKLETRHDRRKVGPAKKRLPRKK